MVARFDRRLISQALGNIIKKRDRGDRRGPAGRARAGPGPSPSARDGGDVVIDVIDNVRAARR